MESFAGVMDYKPFPEGVQDFRKSLDTARQSFEFPTRFSNKPILVCLDSFLYDLVIPQYQSVPARVLPDDPVMHDALRSVDSAYQLYTSINLELDDIAICKELHSSIVKSGYTDGAVLFVVGGLHSMRRIPPCSALNGFGRGLARRFWAILGALSTAFKTHVTFLGAG
jgi:hypothetical protein